MVKDFAQLYALAHEYHEWLNAANYLAPDRTLVQLIAQNPPLVAKLRRFDNYRWVLYTQLPGPLPKPQEEDRWFTEYQAEVEILVRPTARQQASIQANKKGQKNWQSNWQKIRQNESGGSLRISSNREIRAIRDILFRKMLSRRKRGCLSSWETFLPCAKSNL